MSGAKWPEQRRDGLEARTDAINPHHECPFVGTYDEVQPRAGIERGHQRISPDHATKRSSTSLNPASGRRSLTIHGNPRSASKSAARADWIARRSSREARRRAQRAAQRVPQPGRPEPVPQHQPLPLERIASSGCRIVMHDKLGAIAQLPACRQQIDRQKRFFGPDVKAAVESAGFQKSVAPHHGGTGHEAGESLSPAGRRRALRRPSARKRGPGARAIRRGRAR